MAGLANALEDNGDSSGTSGLIVAILVLAAGIVSIVTRKSKKKGGNIAITILFAIAALIGFTTAGIYKDLQIWAGWCLICAIMSVVCMIKNKKAAENIKSDEVK